jgi:hypothetical protein
MYRCGQQEGKTLSDLLDPIRRTDRAHGLVVGLRRLLLIVVERLSGPSGRTMFLGAHGQCKLVFALAPWLRLAGMAWPWKGVLAIAWKRLGHA